MKNKLDIRRHYLTLRETIPAAYREKAALKGAQIIKTHVAFEHSEHVACYVGFKNEFDTQPIIEAIWRAGKKCYLPVLCEGRVLSFVQYVEGDKLEVNQLGIFEPYDFSRKIEASKLDLVIMPLVAFDAKGRRIGTGGGYYDRTFAFTHGKSPHTHFAGLGYAAQEAQDLPVDPWDINLSSVITEQEIKYF